MRRLGLIALLMFAAGTTALPARAQSVFDQVRKKAEAAKKAADAIKRKADSTANAAAKARAATASARSAADSAKASVENAANTITSSNGSVAPGPSSGAKATTVTTVPTPTAQPKNGRGGTSAAPAASGSGGPQPLSRSAARFEEQVVFAGDAGSPFAISPRGQHVAGRTLKGSRTVMMYDGVAGPPFDELPGVAGEGNMGGVFSDDGTHHAYVGRQGTQWVVMEDGKEVGRGGPFFQNSGNQTMAWVGFTPRSKHLYYIVS
ncbi:MAG TPA: hypothetical protein VM076_24945, partial [Gemmatimonadaceae bacterium]|nr:hypothetical protein [Gemmatimonadaceae bacterium]